MSRPTDYETLKGEMVAISQLINDEQKLIAKLKRQAKAIADWNEFENYWTQAVADFYKDTELSPKQIRETGIYRIAQDLGSRLAIQAGVARAPDFRDELNELIESRFQTRRAFCQATGLTEDMLSHVLAGRKNLAIDTLSAALSRIGFALRIVPIKPKPLDVQTAS